MQQSPNKMQSAQQSGVCPHCKGTKMVEGRNGQKLTCIYCRGTGSMQSGGKYATK